MSTVIDQNTLFGLTSFSTLNSVVKLQLNFNTYFKMEGYNPITAQYENWHCMGAPLLTPPSGNSLVNISVVTSWVDR